MACPALPTCGLAVTEAERALPTLMDELEAELDRHGLGDERFTVRMTGPVLPGDTLGLDIWPDGSFRARAVERDVVTLDGGHVQMQAA